MKKLLFSICIVAGISSVTKAMLNHHDVESAPKAAAPRPASPSIPILRTSGEFRYFVRPQSPTIKENVVARYLRILKKHDPTLEFIAEDDYLVWAVTVMLKKSPGLLRVRCNYCEVCQLDDLLDEKLCNHTLESERKRQQFILRNMVSTMFLGVHCFWKRLSQSGLKKQPYSIIEAIMEKALRIDKAMMESPASFTVDDQFIEQVVMKQNLQENETGYWTLEREDIDACAKEIDQQQEDLLFGKMD